MQYAAVLILAAFLSWRVLDLQARKHRPLHSRHYILVYIVVGALLDPHASQEHALSTKGEMIMKMKPGA